MAHPSGSSRPARRATAAVLALGLGLLSACSGGDTGAADATTSSSAAETSAAETSSAPATTSSAAPTSAVEAETITATEGEMFIELSEDSFSPGTYTIQIENTGNMPHDLVLEQNGQDVTESEVIQPGQSGTLEVTLEAGDYVFYCSIGAHRAAGMELPITVTA